MKGNLKMDKQFIVLVYRNVFSGKQWEIISESKHGVSLQEAQDIQRYQIKYKRINAENLRIVKVFDAGIPEVVEEESHG